LSEILITLRGCEFTVAPPEIPLVTVQPSPTPTETPGRIIAAVTPASFRASLHRYTEFQAKNLYLGKWLRIKGTVSEVSKESINGLPEVLFVASHRNASVFVIGMEFSSDWANQIAALQRGDQITVVGRVTDIALSESVVRLGDCEFTIP